jgi:hypothetical protein
MSMIVVLFIVSLSLFFMIRSSIAVSSVTPGRKTYGSFFVALRSHGVVVVDYCIMWVVIFSGIYHCGRVGGVLLVHFASKVYIKFGSASYHCIIVSLYH